MKNFQAELKSLNYNPTMSADELSAQITEQAFNTSNLLRNMGQVVTDSVEYRNVFTTHPSVSDLTEDQIIPESTVQSYTTTESDFKKIGSSIRISNEVLDFANYDIEANTATLVGRTMSDKIAELAVANFSSRLTETPNRTLGEDILEFKSGGTNKWAEYSLEAYQLFADLVKLIPDTYDETSKIICNKNNLVYLLTTTTAQGDYAWLVQNGRFLGRYDIVVVDQLPDNVMYFGDMESAFDIVSVTGNQTIDNVTQPDSLKITNTAKYATVAKDTYALVAITYQVV